MALRAKTIDKNSNRVSKNSRSASPSQPHRFPFFARHLHVPSLAVVFGSSLTRLTSKNKNYHIVNNSICHKYSKFKSDSIVISFSQPLQTSQNKVLSENISVSESQKGGT